MGDVIDLRGQSAHLEDDELIENLARFAVARFPKRP